MESRVDEPQDARGGVGVRRGRVVRLRRLRRDDAAGDEIIAAGSAFVIYPVFYARLWFMLRVQTLWAKRIAAGRITLGGVHPDVLVRLARP